jgi:sulfide:quinone oxidoreductase
VLKAIDPGAKRATYATPSGDVTLGYDFIHVVPPMRAPDAVRNSPLPWRQGPLAADGWVEADKATLRHPRYPNVFAVGDIAGVPRGKTAASVKWQVPVVVDNLVAETAGRAPSKTYNGYTSCPMVTGIGKAMLIEFDYDGKLIPSFPFIAPLEELWVSWLIEEKGLKGAYRAMLRGRA